MIASWTERINASIIWTFIRYFTIVIGFFRTLIIANLLTTFEMGQLAFVYLVIEYVTLVVPLGSVNSLNQQLSIKKATNLNLLFSHKDVSSIYSASLWILLLSISTFILIIFLINNFFLSILSEVLKENFLLISSIIILSVIKSFAVIHARMWEMYNRLIWSEILHSFIYLFGVYLYLESFNDINVIFLSLILAILTSIIIIRFNFLNIKFWKAFSISQIKITLSIGLFLMINVIIETLFWGIDRFFIASVLAPDQLANFHIIHTYARAVLMYFTAVTFLFTPIIYTNFNKLKNENSQLIKSFKKILEFSESILILSAISSTIIIPIIIGYLMPAYSNLHSLYGIIIFGLLLKCLAFFPIAYIIATGLHKYLPIYSIILILFLSISYYICFYFLNLKDAISYSSVAVICFLIFLTIVSNHMFGYTNLKEYIVKVYIVYKKIISVTLIYVFLLNQSNIFEFDNIYLGAIIISFIYFNNFLILFKQIILFFRKGKISFIDSFKIN